MDSITLGAVRGMIPRGPAVGAGAAGDLPGYRTAAAKPEAKVLPIDTQREFEALLAPILNGAYGLACNLTRSRDDAEDLVQDAAVQAFRAFGTFQRGTNFRAWFYRILTNQHYYRHRRSKRQVETTAWEDAPDLYLYAKSRECDIHAQAEDPAALVLSKLTTAQVLQAIAGLPDEFRAVCSLNLMDDLPYHEIAEVLGCPVGTVRSRLHRGRKLLQRALWQLVVDAGGLGAPEGAG